MARLATTADVFNAVAEPQRRNILAVLTRGERPVNELADVLHITQPQASKHLRVLRAVRLVEVRSDGQQRFYRLNGEGLKPVHDWVKGFEQFWNASFDRLADYLDELQDKQPKRPT
ncbi:MAG TPA: metalloregulator ArsR/SmtB family transcription factor [Planctomycetota bacterium]|jgi:DNA-binding transcriptional ArsR family regulator|nr:metalloregulator ArsR/SmtB family transcription factor [Planctomycetota bacterium]